MPSTQEIAQAFSHDFAARRDPAVQGIAMALWAGAVPVDADGKTITQWNRGALPVACRAVKRARLGLDWHERDIPYSVWRYFAGRARQIVSHLSGGEISAIQAACFDMVWPSSKGGHMSFQELKQRHR